MEYLRAHWQEVLMWGGTAVLGAIALVASVLELLTPKRTVDATRSAELNESLQFSNQMSPGEPLRDAWDQLRRVANRPRKYLGRSDEYNYVLQNLEDEALRLFREIRSREEVHSEV